MATQGRDAQAVRDGTHARPNRANFQRQKDLGLETWGLRCVIALAAFAVFIPFSSSAASAAPAFDRAHGPIQKTNANAKHALAARRAHVVRPVEGGSCNSEWRIANTEVQSSPAVSRHHTSLTSAIERAHVAGRHASGLVAEKAPRYAAPLSLTVRSFERGFPFADFYVTTEKTPSPPRNPQGCGLGEGAARLTRVGRATSVMSDRARDRAAGSAPILQKKAWGLRPEA